jgi:hypothetical protein
MSPHSPSLIRETLIDLTNAEIAITHRPQAVDPGWFVTHHQESHGPYASAEAAVQAGSDWCDSERIDTQSHNEE